MDFRLLGPIEVFNAKSALPLGGVKQRSVLALLLLHRGEVVSSERLIDELWGERPPATAAKVIHVYVSRLRKSLGDGVLETHGHGYRLAVDADQVDAERFERLVAEGRRQSGTGAPDRAAETLQDALSLWRGSALADLAYEEFAQDAAGRLDELRMVALEELVCAELDLGRHVELVPRLDALVREHPYRERLLEQLMIALYRCGRQAEALERYSVWRRSLDEERGLAPGQALRDLERAILLQAPELDPPQERRRAAALKAPNPYKGLRAFEETDAPDFFGRDALVERLVAQLAETRFLTVVGPSGSGKSSLVRAGLVPALRAGALPGSERWPVAQMFPGTDPFAELQRALETVADDLPPDVAEGLQAGDGALLATVEGALQDRGAELLLVVDQLEELFTLVKDEHLRGDFLSALREAVCGPDRCVRVVVTLRADFFDRPLLHRAIAGLVGAHSEALVPLSPEELERAITGPAERVGATLEPGLLAEMVADVVDEPGALPLLQYALTELFDRRDVDILTRAAYDAIGGATGALAGRAEAVYAALTPAGRAAARQLFLRLVTLGEGIEDTRRRVGRRELESTDIDADAISAAIESFAASRLLSLDRDPATEAPTVEVAHEALLREWNRLRAWIDQARDELSAQRRLSAAAAEWEEAGRDPSFLLRGSHLGQFEAWAASSDLAMTSLERRFLQDSIDQRRLEQRSEEARREHETALERRSLRRMRALGVVLATAAVIAGVLTVIAFRQSHDSRTQAGIAAGRALAAASVANLGVDPERSILLAIKAVDTYRSAEGSVPPDAVEALHQAVETSRVLLTLPVPAGNVSLDTDGALIATGGYAVPPPNGATALRGQAIIWNAYTGKRVRTLPEQPSPVGDVQLSPDGSLLATIVGQVTILWDVQTGRKVRTLRGPPPNELAFDSDGSRLAVTSTTGTLTIWDLATGRPSLRINAPSPLCGLDFSFDDARIAAAGCFSGDTATVWDARSGRRLLSVGRGHGSVLDVAFSPDADRLVTGGVDAKARVWDARTGRLLATLAGHTGWVVSVSFSADGFQIATGSSDGTARVWNARTGRQQIVLAGHTRTVNDAIFSPEGQQLVTGADDAARVWDLWSASGRREIALVRAHSGVPGTSAVAYSPDGSHFVTGGERPSARLFESSGASVCRSDVPHLVVTGCKPWSVHHDGAFTDAAYSPDGKRILLTGNGTPVIVDAASAKVVVRIRPHSTDPFFPGAAWAPGGEYVAIGGADGTATIWEARSGELLRTFRHSRDATSGAGTVNGVAFSPDGRRLASASWDHTAKIWDVASGRLLRTLTGHSDQVNRISFSPDGRRVVTASSDGTARIWDVASGRQLATLSPGAGAIWDAAFSPDGKLVATAGDDSTARLWDPATGREELKLTGSRLALHDLSFSPDGRYLATASADGTVHVYVLHLNELMTLAESRVTRRLTAAECRQYLGSATC